MEKRQRFRHNLSLEYVMWDLFGPRHYQGLAGAVIIPEWLKEMQKK